MSFNKTLVRMKLKVDIIVMGKFAYTDKISSYMRDMNQIMKN